ncbi:hypothetical protein ASF33_04915 [Methylobacterium sp. Leaf92]|nr:hypothetical protein ASF33_04915 [Methylobacterium sp. Leaf92]
MPWRCSSERPSATGDRACETGGDLSLGAAETLDVRRGDVDGDRDRTLRSARGDAEAAVALPRLSGRIASGPASPIRPVSPPGPASGK